jgi:hypothetical protein
MSMGFQPVQTPQDAILYCEFLERFAIDQSLQEQMGGIARVVRDLCRRLEEQAVHLERVEARGGVK